jgi:shikimate dehydrogenase
VSEIALFDQSCEVSQSLAGRLREHYPELAVTTSSNGPAGFDLVVNATPLGMKEDDPLPFDVSRIAARSFVGEVVMKHVVTPLLAAAQAQGLCHPDWRRPPAWCSTWIPPCTALSR